MRIVCFGDSLMTCGGEGGRVSDILAARFPSHVFLNSGAGGETLRDALARIDADVLAAGPDVVLLSFGANDWWRGERGPDEWAADLGKIVERIVKCGAAPVILGVFGPWQDESGRRVPKSRGTDERGARFADGERRIAEAYGCRYVPNMQATCVGRRCCWTDANHPNEYGNRHVADTVEPILEELLGERARPIRKPVLHTTRDFWSEAVALKPDGLAVVDGGRRLTFREAHGQVERLAAGLMRAGGTARPAVAVFLPNGLEYFLLYWAVARLGGTIVPLNTWLKAGSLAGIFRNARPDVLVVRSLSDREALQAARETPACAVVALESGWPGMRSWAALFEGGDSAPEPDVRGEDVSVVMHTSGTTAAPKGAVMRHCDLVFNVMAAVNAHRFTPADVHLLVNPMFHCTALYSQLPAAAYTRTPVIIASSASATGLMDLVQRERITTFLSVPPVFQQILKIGNLEDYDARSLRLMAYAGSPMPIGAVRRLALRFPGVQLHNFFGLTETISMTHVLTGDEAADRPDSIGRLLPFVEAIVVGEDGCEVPPGEVGELLFARENVICGYINEPGRLEESMLWLGGRQWFRTGDLAMRDAEGFFFVRGRKKDMIIVGGENVYAEEVENVLLAHAGVEAAAVKGVPATGAAAYLGERIAAYVVPALPSLTESELRRHCFERLPSYKVPHRLVFLEDLPRNPAGKVVKGELP